MKTIPIIIGISALAGLYQWRQLAHHQQREQPLRQALHELKKSQPSPSAATPGTGRRLHGPAREKAEKSTLAAFMQSLHEMMEHQDAQGDPDDAAKQAILTRLLASDVSVLRALPGELSRSSLPEKWKRELTSVALRCLGHHDPRAAAGAALEHSDHRSLTAILQQWQTSAPQAAAVWITAALTDGRITASTFTDGPFLGPDGLERLRGMAESVEVAGTPGEASQRFHNLPLEKITIVMAETMRLLAPAERTALLRSLAADPQVPSTAFGAFGQSLGQKLTFAEARALLEQTALSPQQFSSAASGYISKSIGKDTPEALTWFLSNTTGYDRRNGYPQILLQWIHADYNAAAAWLRDLPAGDDKDTGIRMFAPLIVRKEPASAADWAATIQAPEARAQALQKVFATWPDKAAATAYYTSNGWTVE
jgi:hypothetical protein